jgi:hypothetical protein
MSEFFAKTHEWLRRRRDGFYRKKYMLIAKLIGRGGAHSDLSERGLLLIQLDALPYETLREAIDAGRMPFLQRELRQDNLHLKKWYSGVPSNTPSVQAALLYGNNDNIPGFRWYEKDTDLHVNFKNPLSAGLVQERLDARFEGVLKGGSSYSNMFSGEADTAVATFGAFTQLNIARRLRGLQLLVLALINIITVFRTVYYTVREFAIELNDWAHFIRHRLIQRSEYLFPLYRILMNVWVRELITVGAMTDIARGSPSIYVSYMAYDELAHQRGPLSKSALSSLKTIDRRIRRIVRLARRNILREYDVFVFSDHGTANSMPFFFLYGQTLAQFVSQLANNTVTAHQHEPPGESQVTYARILALRLENYERELMRGLRFIVGVFRRVLQRRVEKDQQSRFDGDDVVVCVSGPLAHIYLPSPERVHEEEIERRYPELITGLLSHGGIGVVVTRSGDKVIVRSSEGSANVDTQAQPRLVCGDPLPRIDPEPLAFRGLRRLMDMTNSGDIVVLGADHLSHIVNFEEQMAAHGGIGGLQNSAFLMHQPEYDASCAGIVDPLALHEIFKAVYTRGSRGVEPMALTEGRPSG